MILSVSVSYKQKLYILNNHNNGYNNLNGDYFEAKRIFKRE